MDILFTICGRAGSKGVKNKNLKEFLGYPLAFYTVSAISLYKKRNPNINASVVLNTDSDNLIDLFKRRLSVSFDIIKRCPNLGLDNTPKIAVIQECLRVMKERAKVNYGMVIDLDITSPLRTAKDIENLVNTKTNSDADVVFSVTESRRNPYFNMVKRTNKGYVKVIEAVYNARQEAPEVYDMNASLYAYSPGFLEEGRGLFEGKCDIIKMKDTAVLDIDNENDFNLMQVIAEYLYNKDQDYKEVRDNIKEICCKRNSE